MSTPEPQTQTMLEQLAVLDTRPAHEQNLADARQAYDLYGGMSPRPESVTAEDLSIPGPAGELRARVYRPGHLQRPTPGLVYFHGGGYVIGSIESHDAACGLLAEAGDFAVVSVEYRLAPEHPHPASLEDGLAAWQWISARADEVGLDPARLGVGGDSAGGNLAAVLVRRCRDEGVEMPAAQLLVYPVTDLTCARPSMEENAEGYVLERPTLEWFRENAVPDATRWRDADVSPLFVEDLSGLPPAVVATAEFDPLRDQGDAYARRLADAGVEVRHLRYQGLIHTFLQIPAISDASRVATEEIAAEFATFLSGASA